MLAGAQIARSSRRARGRTVTGEHWRSNTRDLAPAADQITQQNNGRCKACRNPQSKGQSKLSSRGVGLAENGFDATAK